MNLTRLKHAESTFLHRYPGGFDNPEMKALRNKKHMPDQMIALAQKSFSREKFDHPRLIVHNMERVISRSSVISMFEKPRIRDFVDGLSHDEKAFLSHGLEQVLHGNEQTGFEMMLDLYKREKLAKWSLTTVCQAYFHPQRDVFIKPTTIKGVIQYFELENLHYQPTPAWAFYDAYRLAFLEMKSKVHPTLSPTNPAFSGFLWMTVRGEIF